MQLILPSTEYKESFIQALKEYQSDRSNDRMDILELNSETLEHDFSSYVTKLVSESKGENLPEGYVPQTTYWLVDNNEFIGRVSIRHQLNDYLLKEGGHIGYDIRPSKRNMGYGKKILALVLPKVKELGIDKVLVTCNDTNIGSKKIIEANGGVLENAVPTKEGKSNKLRYWITVR